MSTEELISRIERLERVVSRLMPTGETWVEASVITAMTGWDSEGMRKARRNGSVKARIKKGRRGYQYLLQSIPQHMIRKESA